MPAMSRADPGSHTAMQPALWLCPSTACVRDLEGCPVQVEGSRLCEIRGKEVHLEVLAAHRHVFPGLLPCSLPRRFFVMIGSNKLIDVLKAGETLEVYSFDLSCDTSPCISLRYPHMRSIIWLSLKPGIQKNILV